MVLSGNCQVAVFLEYKLRMPASILWFSSTTDVIFQVLPAFWTHFAFFLGCWFLVRFHRSIEIWPHLSLIRGFYFHHGFGIYKSLFCSDFWPFGLCIFEFSIFNDWVFIKLCKYAVNCSFRCICASNSVVLYAVLWVPFWRKTRCTERT